MNLKTFFEKFNAPQIEGIAIKIYKKQFIITKEQEKFVHKKILPAYAGIYLGEEREEKFLPSLELLHYIAQHTTQKIKLDNQGTWLFTCGKDAWKQHATLINANAEQYVLVCTKDETPIGIGIVEEKKIKNIYDIGDYLRREHR